MQHQNELDGVNPRTNYENCKECFDARFKRCQRESSITAYAFGSLYFNVASQIFQSEAPIVAQLKKQVVI